MNHSPNESPKRDGRHFTCQQNTAIVKVHLVDGVAIAELTEENLKAKRVWGTLSGQWVSHDTRDEIVDYFRKLSERTELATGKLFVLGALPLGR